MANQQKIWLNALLIALISGCGSDDSSSLNNTSQSQTSPTVVYQQEVNLGDGVSFIAPNSSTTRQIQWQQTQGSRLSLSHPAAPLTAFLPPEVGQYTLTVEVDEQLTTFELTVSGNDDRINSYSDQAVVSGGRVSLRAEALDDAASDYPDNLNWRQVTGLPLPDLASEEPQLLTFTAPYVSQDTLYTFELTGWVEGVMGRDEISVLVTADPEPSNYAYFDEPLARIAPYRSDSPWGEALQQCVYSNQLNGVCSMEALPLIGQVTATPTIEDVLDRVVVSHPWMGAQFEYFLRNYDPYGDFVTLLSAVSAVVISSDIRPSFYWPVFGAIYLDPADLWQYPWQRATINEDPDYRTGFGSALQFIAPWRYVFNNDYVSYSYPAGSKYVRSWAHITPDLASLLYHELAHANDYFPRSSHATLSGQSLLAAALERIEQQALISDSLNASYPLNSALMKGLAQVSFQGNDADDTQQTLTPADVASAYFDDRASEYYAYITYREDLAMLFEETMLQHRYGYLRDTAIISTGSANSETSLIIAQGQRGRVGDDALQARVQLVFDAIWPELGRISQQLVSPQWLNAGANWFDAIVVPESSNNLNRSQFIPLSLETWMGNPAFQGNSYVGPRHGHFSDSQDPLAPMNHTPMRPLRLAR